MARIDTIHSFSVGTNVRSHRTSSASILSLIARLAVSALSISMRLVRMATSGYRAGYKYAAVSCRLTKRIRIANSQGGVLLSKNPLQLVRRTWKFELIELSFLAGHTSARSS